MGQRAASKAPGLSLILAVCCADDLCLSLQWCVVQSPALPHVDFEDLVGTHMLVKVLEAKEEEERLVLSNRKNAFGTKKLTHNVGSCAQSHCTTDAVLTWSTYTLLGMLSQGCVPKDACHIATLARHQVDRQPSLCFPQVAP